MNETDRPDPECVHAQSDCANANRKVTSEQLLAAVQSALAARPVQRRNALPPQALEKLDGVELEGLEYYPWRRRVGCWAEVNLRDLIECPREAFVRRCYRLLLLRDPTRAEQTAASQALDAGWDRLLLVVWIRWSREGRQNDVPLHGLGKRLGLALTRSLKRRVRLHPRNAP